MTAGPPPEHDPDLPPALGPEALAAYLAGRRWSGARGGELQVLGAGSAYALFEEPATVLRVVPVQVAGGAPYELLMPWVVRRANHADVPSAADQVVDLGGGWVAFDATLDGEVRQGLLDAVRGDVQFESEDVVARPLRGAAVPPSITSRVSSAEQSNTSLVYPDAGVMLKLFRRVEAGENPDVEIGRFLAGRDFPHTPRLLGTVMLRREGEVAVVGMAQQLVAGAEDAWAYAVRSATVAVQGTGGAPGYADEAARLGRVTRALHDALASAGPGEPDFTPEPADGGRVAQWAAAAERALAGAVRAAEASAAPGAALVHARQDDVRGLIARTAAGLGDDAGVAVRHHGDYHLGQVLRTADGALFVIDFEGEPAKPLAERRAKHSPLRDAAGMLRSFGYAAAFAERASDRSAAARARAAEWEQAAREAFLGAYFAGPGGEGGAGDGPVARYLPSTRAGADALLALFELEKAVYEVQYELQNRPDWVDIPLAGLARLLGGPGAPDAGAA